LLFIGAGVKIISKNNTILVFFKLYSAFRAGVIFNKIEQISNLFLSFLIGLG
jgi:hypothetical protein